MSTKALDQVGRTGAFHHIIRRKAAVSDTGLNNLKDVQAKVIYLPLTADGVFGKGLEENLKKRKEQKEQLVDLIPEYDTSKGDNSQKRKFSSNDRNTWSYKKPRYDYAVNNTTRGRSRGASYSAYKGSDYKSKSSDYKGKTDKQWSGFRIPKKQKRLTGKILSGVSGDTCRRASQIFPKKLAKNNKRSMGLISNKRGLQTGVSSKKPPQTGIRETSVRKENLDILEAEVEDLLRKDAIEIVPLYEINSGFYSTFFLVPKKSRKMRPVINLRPLNIYLRKTHFKMDTFVKVLNLVKPKDWAISLDLSDAYLHIPIFVKHRKFLRFCINKKCYQFKSLCFGPTCAPRVFSKILAVIAAHLREQNIRLTSYLDD